MSKRKTEQPQAETNQHIFCDTCKAEFYPKLKHKSYERGVVLHYFTCPHCGQQYIYHIQDAQIHDWIMRRRRIGKGDIDKYNELGDKIAARQRELIDEVFAGQEVIVAGGGVR